MPIGRILLKSISESKKLSLLKTDGARLLYSWLIPHLDVNGCFSGDCAVINGQVLTRLKKTNKEIEEYLQDLEQNKLIIHYKFNGDIFLNVPDFVEKQPYLNPSRETSPKIPLPTKELIKRIKQNEPVEKPKKEIIKKETTEEKTHSFSVQDFYALYNALCTNLLRAERLTESRREVIC